jgi:hypothetical protein
VLAEFLGGRLDEAAAGAVAAHVAACADCAALLDGVPDGPVEELLRATVPDPDGTLRGGAAPASGPGADPGGGWPSVPGYQILGELGRGGMGVVYKARQPGLGRLVALKMIRGGPNRPELQARLRGEAEALARLKHPQIVQVYEAGWHSGEPYFVLEYVAGGSLAAHLEAAQRGGALALTPARAAALVEGLARAMHHAHGQGVVHRDLKPANVLLEFGAGPGADFTPKITDFGLAKLLGAGRADETRTGVILGTPGYLAPEQAEGRAKEVGPAADVYALGAVLYEPLTGRPPFQGESVLDTLAQVRERDPVPPRRLQPRVPRDLETVCLTCLRKDPRRRYVTAEALAEDLRRHREGRPVLARPVSAWGHAWKWARRNPGWAAVAAVSAAALAALLGGGLYYNRQLDAKAEAARRSAGEAVRQRDLALKAYNRLVYDVQEKLHASPATLALRRGLLTAAAGGLREIAAGAADSAAPDASRAAAHALLGAVESELGNADEALRQFEAGEAVAAAVVAADADNLRARAALCQALNGRGLVILRRDKPDEARPVLERLVAEAEAWATLAPDDGEARAARIKSRAALAYALVWRWDVKAAEPLLREAERLALAWRGEEPASVPALEALDLVYGRLSGWCTASHDPAAALEYDAKQAEVCREMARLAPGNVRYKSSLVIALGNVAANAQALGRTDLYLRSARDALAKAAELAAADPDNVEVAGLHLIALTNAGDASLDELRPDEARARFAEADRLLRRLDEAGKLKGLASYDETRDRVRGRLALCDLLPGALTDPRKAAASPSVAAGALEQCCRLHLKGGRPDAAAKAAEALAALESSDKELLFGKAGGLARCLEAFDAAPPAAKAACPRDRLTAAAADALSRAVDRGFDDLGRLETDVSLRALRGSPGYRAAVERLCKKKS